MGVAKRGSWAAALSGGAAMTRRKNAKTIPDSRPEEALPELFADSDNGQRVGFHDIDWVAFGRLASLVVDRGAFIGLYHGAGDNVICLSVSLGEKRRRYEAEDADQFDQIVNGLSIKFGVPRPIAVPKPPKP